MAGDRLSDREIRQVRRRLAAGETPTAIAADMEVSPQAIGQFGRKELGKEMDERDARISELMAFRLTLPISDRELCAGACLYVFDLPVQSSAQFKGQSYGLPDGLVEQVLAGYKENGSLVVNGVYCTEADARARRAAHNWQDSADF